METYDPTAIVLQCGADSLSGDRLGCFNLSLEGHADCVEFMKSFNRPLLLLGGGGYTMRNVARCWTAETAVALDTELDQQLPFTDYYEYFGPDYGLPIVPSNMEDLNPPEELKRIQEILLRNLEALENKPSVPFQERADDMPTTFAAGGASADKEPDPDARVSQRRFRGAPSPPAQTHTVGTQRQAHMCAHAARNRHQRHQHTLTLRPSVCTRALSLLRPWTDPMILRLSEHHGRPRWACRQQRRVLRQ
jgi:hypothetical protein